MCIQPLTLDDRIVPCGKCVECKARRVSQWSIRLINESKYCESAHFITFTYENRSNEKTSDTARFTQSGLRTLVLRDVQLFWKRVRHRAKKRRRDGSSSIRYYCAGEYGTNTQRPHYHAIVFNATAEELERSWPHGFMHFGTVTGASIGYCLKYISKGTRIPMYKGDDRLPEFSVMSQGIGAGYLTDAMIKYHKADPVNRACIQIEDGKLTSMPRYYKERIFNVSEFRIISEHYENKMIDDFLKDHGDMSHEDWVKHREKKRQQVAASYRMMKDKGKNNQKL